MPTGTIRITATPSGKRLDLMVPNPDPPPERVSMLALDPVPPWIADVTLGNAGQPCTIVLDEAGAPIACTVG
jgi:hypothetical protein